MKINTIIGKIIFWAPVWVATIVVSWLVMGAILALIGAITEFLFL